MQTVTFASSHVASEVYQQLKKASVHNIVWFLQNSAANMSCSTVRGILFEEYVIDHQAQGGEIGYECNSHSMDKQVEGSHSPPLCHYLASYSLEAQSPETIAFTLECHLFLRHSYF